MSLKFKPRHLFVILSVVAIAALSSKAAYRNHQMCKTPTIAYDASVDAKVASHILSITDADYYGNKFDRARHSDVRNKRFDIFFGNLKVHKIIHVRRYNPPVDQACYEVYYNVNYDEDGDQIIPVTYYLDENYRILRTKLMGRPIF